MTINKAKLRLLILTGSQIRAAFIDVNDAIETGAELRRTIIFNPVD